MKNFIVTGTQRTGSSALSEAIAFHPKVACGWEWTKDSVWHKKISIVRSALKGDLSQLEDMHQQHLKDIDFSSIGYFGYRRLFRSSPKWIISPSISGTVVIDRLFGHLNWLRKNQKIKIIHIVRDNNMEWIKSIYLSKKTKLYVGKPYAADIKMKIPINESLKRIEAKLWIDEKLHELNKTNEYVRIKYEDFLLDNSAVANQVLDFLGCSRIVIEGNIQKIKRQSKQVAKDYILNCDELASSLSKFGYDYNK